MVEVKNISRSFGGIKAVKSVNFSVEKNKITSIIGPNGAGKTTVFNLLTGVFKPDEGSIHLHDTNITGLPTNKIALKGISRTFQNLQIFSNMTVMENIMTGMHINCKTNLVQAVLGLQKKEEKKLEEKALEYLGILELEKYAGMNAGELPFGILRQVEITRAIAASPDLVLLDEPAAGLNSFETDELSQKILRIKAKGITVLLIEHDMNLVMRISDHIIVLNFGEKIAEGLPDEIQKNPLVIKAYLGE